MAVFVKRAAFPAFERQREHVVAITGRPVRHRHSGFMTGHQTAHADQHQRGNRGKEREAMQPGIVAVLSHEKGKPLAALAPAVVQLSKNYFASNSRSALTDWSLTSTCFVTGDPTGAALR